MSNEKALQIKTASIHVKRKKRINSISIVFFGILSMIVLFPVIYMVCNSFMSPAEVNRYYYLSMQESGAGAKLHLIPDILSLESYYEVFLRRPDYLIKFWNSLLLCGAILFGQVIISCMGGYAFAKYKFAHQKLLFYFLIVLMMMPIQVTLVPNYIVLDKLHLINTWWALILPAAFLPFGTFLMTQIFKGIPNEIIDAARLDGATTFKVLLRILIPMGKSGLISLILLNFIDSWNMVEQPVVFLQNSTQYPLSVFLAGVNSNNFSLSFACGILALLPVLVLFLFFNQELVEGIEFSGIK